MSQDVSYRPAPATESGMHDRGDTGIGCQSVGSHFGHRAKRESRSSASVSIEWRMSIDQSGAEKEPLDGDLYEAKGVEGGSGKSTVWTKAFRFASFAVSGSTAMAGLCGIKALLVQIAGFGEILSPLSKAFLMSSCLTASNRCFEVSLCKFSEPLCSTNATALLLRAPDVGWNLVVLPRLS